MHRPPQVCWYILRPCRLRLAVAAEGGYLRQVVSYIPPACRTGELVSGWDVALAVNRLSHGLKDNAAGGNTGAVIVAAGQLRRGTPVDVANL